MKHKKKIIAVILGATLVFCIAGCSSKKSEPAVKTPAADTKIESVAETASNADTESKSAVTEETTAELSQAEIELAEQEKGTAEIRETVYADDGFFWREEPNEDCHTISERWAESTDGKASEVIWHAKPENGLEKSDLRFNLYFRENADAEPMLIRYKVYEVTKDSAKLKEEYCPIYINQEEKNLFDVIGKDCMLYVKREDCEDCQRDGENILAALNDSQVPYITLETVATKEEAEQYEGSCIVGKCIKSYGVFEVPDVTMFKDGEIVTHMQNCFSESTDELKMNIKKYYQR